MPHTPDPILAALEQTPTRRAYQQMLLDELYGDRPDVLAKIIERRQQGASCQALADALTSISERQISRGAVARWLKSRGVA